MTKSELINEILSEWAYRVDDGQPNPKNEKHLAELSIVLSEMGLSDIKAELFENITEADKNFSNPILNKEIPYKAADGSTKKGIVGNLLRLPKDSEGRKAAEKLMPPEGSPERDSAMQDLGSEKDGKSGGADKEKGKEDEKGKEGEKEKGAGEEEKAKAAQAMFDPKADPAMGARLDREKAANDKLAQQDKKDATPPWVEDPESVKAKMANVSKEKAAALEKGYNDSTHAMSDRQLDASAQKAQQKYDDALKKGDDKGADAARLELTQHKIEKNRRSNPSVEEKDNDFGFKDLKADYEKKHGEPYEADIEYPFTDFDDTKGKRASADRTPSGWMGDGPKEPEAGPEAGPNAEPPANEPSKPDTTPPNDAEQPKDGEEPPAPAALGDKPEKTPIDKTAAKIEKLLDKAESDANDIESLKKFQAENPELFANTGLDWDKMDPAVLNQVKNRKETRDQIKQNVQKEKTKEQTTKAASELKGRKSKDGEDLDVETTDNGSMIIGVEHGEGNESTKKTIESIQQLPKDTKVMFVGEGGMSKDDNGNLELSGEQAEIRDAVKGHFDNAEEGSWDENANVLDDTSPVFDEVAKSVGGSKSKSKAAIWSNMYGQDGPDENMKPDDYLDDEGKAWIIDQAKKAGATNITDKTDFNNLTDAEQKDLYELNYNDEGKMGDNEIGKAQEAYNGFRQKELDRKVKEAEDKGYTVVAPVGNSHVDMWRQRNKSKQKPEETPTDTKPEDKPDETPKEEPKAAETPKATKDDIKKEKPGKEAKTDSGGSLYSVGGGYYSDKPNGPAKYVRTESVIEMAFDNSLNEDVFALFEKSITGTLQNGEKITVQELPPRAVKKATQRAKAAAATSKEEPTQQPTPSTEKPAETPKASTDSVDTFNPIDVKNVAKEMPKANTDTFSGGSDIPDAIDPKELEQFNTDINKVAQQVADAKAKGEPAPNINLCDVTVPGTNLYCDDNLGIPRDEMPQFKGNAAPGSRAAGMEADASGEVDTEPVFREMLAQKGIKTLQTEVPADKLKATQKDLVGAKVIGMMGALEKDPNHPKITAPIYVSRDGYVIDGHHRWAAVVAYNAQNPDKQIPMKTTVLDMDIKDAIPMANKFAEDMGIAAKKADANKEAPTSAPNKAIAASAQKAIDKIKAGVKNWSVEEKEFFVKKVHKGNSPERRTFGEAFKDKAKGAWEAIKHGAEHEVHLFKSAGSGVKNFFSGGKVSDEEKKALIGVAKKVAIAAAFGAVGGGLAHGAVAFGKHVMIEFIPHVVAETVAMGAGKAALFAGAEDDDADMMKFMEIISKKLQSADIPNEVMADAIESYNKNKEDKNTNEMRIESLIREIISEIKLEEANPKKPGESRDYPGYFHRGRGYYSKQPDGEITHKSDGGTIVKLTAKEKAEKNKNQTTAAKPAAQPAGKKLKANDFRQTPDMEKKPTKVAPKPEPNATQAPTKKKAKKNKQLKQNVNTRKTFNEGYFSQDGVSDKDFKKNPKVKSTPNQMNINELSAFFTDKNGNTNFPKKYLKVLHRLMNTQGGTGLSISDFTDVSGAGTLPSTMGELLTLMAVTIKDEKKANEFFQMTMAHVKGNGKASIIDPGWVKSAQLVRETMFKRFDRQYGKGNWQLDSMGWDTEKEVEGLGLENYKENKGFSTDVYAKVKVGGKYVLDEVSLKKEIKANLLNATSNRVQDIMVRGMANDEDLKIYDDLNSRIEALAPLKDSNSKAEKKELSAQRDAIIEKYNLQVPENVKVSYAQKKQREMHQDFIKDGEPEVKEFLGKFCGKDKKFRENAANVINKQLNQNGDAYKAQLTQKVASICKEVASGKSYGEALIGLEKSDYQKLNLGIMSYIATENPNSKAAKSYKNIVDNSHSHSKAVRDFLLSDKNARKGLFASIREDFPLKALFEGEENMILGDVSADRQVLQDVFGVKTFEELEQKLAIRDNPPPPSIVYSVEGKEDIPVAEIKSRPDGIGYGGTWKLEMGVHAEFAKRLKESNLKLNK